MHLSKSTAIIIIVVVAAFLIGVGVLVGTHVSGGTPTNGASLSPYSAVYLSTGAVYFGILDWSPSPHIEDPWFLQSGTNAQGQATAGVYPFSQVAWGPSDAVYFNSQDIVWWTRLSSTSSVAEAMANPAAGAAAQQPNGAPTQQPPTPTSTSTASSSLK
ncbi:MAG TPA: hypothetical protein VIJ29_02370 [Candidatus Paceibacterota bacterium]